MEADTPRASEVAIRRVGEGDGGSSARQEHGRIELHAASARFRSFTPPSLPGTTKMSRRNCGPERRCETADPVPERLMQSPDPVSAAPSGRPKHRAAPRGPQAHLSPTSDPVAPFPHAIPNGHARRGTSRCSAGVLAEHRRRLPGPVARRPPATQVLPSGHRRRSGWWTREAYECHTRAVNGRRRRRSWPSASPRQSPRSPAPRCARCSATPPASRTATCSPARSHRAGSCGCPMTSAPWPPRRHIRAMPGRPMARTSAPASLAGDASAADLVTRALEHVLRCRQSQARA